MYGIRCVLSCSVRLWYLFSVPPAEAWCGGSVRSRSTSSHVQSICDICSVCHLLKSGVAALFSPDPHPAMFSPSLWYVFSLPPAEVWCGGSVRSRVRDHVKPCSVHLWYVFSVPPAEVRCGGSVRSRVRDHVQPCSVHLWRHGDPPHRDEVGLPREEGRLLHQPLPQSQADQPGNFPYFYILNKFYIKVRFRTISLRLVRVSPLFYGVKLQYCATIGPSRSRIYYINLLVLFGFL